MSVSLAVDDPVLLAFAEDIGATGPVAVVGRRTRWDLGGPPTGEPRLISAPTGVVEYKPEEMIVRVRAGTLVSELHAELAEKGQRSALPDRGGTVGGALVVGENDFRALGRGRLRDSVLQVRYVSAEGRVVNSGGPTVKNVSGFDLPRLMVGSLGTLGLIAEVIVRTNPIPEETRWLTATGVDAQAALDALLHPSAVLSNGAAVWVQLEGHGPDVEQQVEALGKVGDFDPVDGPPPFPAHRWSVTPSEAASFVAPDGGSFVAAIGLGLIFADTPQPLRPLDEAVSLIGRRVKDNFDPQHRLNPGRNPANK